MMQKVVVGIGLLSGVGLAYLLNTTTPSSAGALGVLAVFFLSYTLLVSALTIFIYWVYVLIRRVFYTETATAQHREVVSLKRSYYYASVLSLAPVLFVSLKSVGKAGLIEALLVVFLVLLGCVYVSRQTS